MKGLRTVVLGILIALISVFSNADMQAFISEHIPAIGGSIGTAVIVLRAITTSSIFKKD